MQSVKEVLQSLVDDNLVTTEKIGTSNYFWSFPSTAVQTRKNKIAQLQADIEKMKNTIETINVQIEDAKIGREESEERELLIIQLNEKESARQKNVAELELFKDMDPDLFEEKKKDTMKAKEAVNRWTDNIYSLQSYCFNKFMIAKADFNTQFGIPEDLDYI